MKFGKLLILLSLVGNLVHAETEKQSIYSAKYERHFFLGLKAHPKPEAAPNRKFLESDAKVPNDLFWPDRMQLPAGLPYDQGQCGSCVVNSINGNVTYNLAIRGLLPNASSPLSRGQTMECNPTAGQCGGDYAENVGGWVGKRGHLLPESAYSYRPQNGRCRNISGTELGPIPTGSVIDNSPESIGKALVVTGPVSTTIGADSSWMNTGPVYDVSQCTNQGTNHEVLIIGMRAKGSARGVDGFINFAAAKPGEIEIAILNSWGNWAKGGVVWMPITNSRGNLCNNVTEEIYAFNFPPLAKPVDGGWSDFSAFGECKDGKQTRTRTCTNPAPSGGGMDCQGAPYETKACSEPVPGGIDVKFLAVLGTALLGVILAAVALFRK